MWSGQQHPCRTLSHRLPQKAGKDELFESHAVPPKTETSGPRPNTSLHPLIHFWSEAAFQIVPDDHAWFIKHSLRTRYRCGREGVGRRTLIVIALPTVPAGKEEMTNNAMILPEPTPGDHRLTVERRGRTDNGRPHENAPKASGQRNGLPGVIRGCGISLGQ